MINFLLLFLFFPLSGKDNGKKFIGNYSKADYLGNSKNYCLLTTNDGRLFVGNDRGLLTFDGNKWNLTTVANNSLYSLCHNDSLLYVGGLNEFGFYKQNNNGNLIYVSLRKKLQITNLNLGSIEEAIAFNKKVYFSSLKGIVSFNGNNITFISAETQFNLLFKAGNKLFVQVKDRGIFEIVNESLIYVQKSDFFNDKWIMSACQYNEKFLIGSYHAGIHSLSKNGITEFNKELNKFLEKHRFQRIKVLSSGKMAIGTKFGGLLIVDQTGQILMKFDKLTGLMDNRINGISEDKYGNLWVATHGGLSYISLSSSVSFYSHFPELKNVTDILRISDRLFISSISGGFIYSFDSENQNEQLLKKTPEYLWNLNLIKNTVFASSSNGLLNLYDPAKKVFKSSIGFTKVSSSFKNRVYINENRELSIYDISSNNWRKENHIPVNTGIVTSIEEIGESEIWVGTLDNGFFRIQLNNGLFQLTDHYLEIHGKESIKTDVYRLNDTLYIATLNQFYQYNPSLNAFFKYSFDNSNGNMRNFSKDINNTVWYSNNGVARVHKNKNLNRLLNQIPYTNLNAIYPDSFGNVWLGYEDGLVRYDSKIKKDIDQTFPINITKITLNQDSVLFGGFHPLEGEKHSFKINFSQNQLRFNYAAAYYEMPEKTIYSYKLEGYDSKWSVWTSETFKDYTGLYEGDYTFHVKAKNVYETEGVPTRYHFVILAPWYRTWWAYSAYGMLLLCLTFGILHFISSRKLKKLEQLRRIEKAEAIARETALQAQVEKEQLRSRISQDLHDEIGSNLSSISLMSELLKRKQSDTPFAGQIEKILSISKQSSTSMREIVWFVNPENESFPKFIGKMEQTLRLMLEHTDVHYSCTLNPEIFDLDINAKRNVFLMLKEILQNIIKHSEATEVWVEINEREGHLQLKVSDNGKGFDTNLQSAGNGLNNYQKRAAKMNGAVEISSEIAKGTEIVITVPFLKRQKSDARWQGRD